MIAAVLAKRTGDAADPFGEATIRPYQVALGDSRLTGLTPATTYHFRLVASNAKGTARSATMPDGIAAGAATAPP